MKKSRRILWIIIPWFLFTVFACVTINIYFPAEKVESVAGDIVNEIRGDQTEEKRPKTDDKNSLLRKTLLALSPSVAWAQEETTVSNPSIRALKNRMRARYTQMKPYYQKGMLVEGSNGYVTIGDSGGLGLKEKRDLLSLVDAENKDRNKLYEEVAKALNIDPSQVDRIAGIFAKEWQKTVK